MHDSPSLSADDPEYSRSEQLPKPRRGITTRKTLIQKVQEGGDRASWEDFYQTYRGFIISIGMKMGLSSHDAEDLMSRVFEEVHQKFTHDPDLDFQTQSFGGWLGNLVKWRTLDHFRRSKQKEHMMDDEILTQLAPTEPFESIWDREWSQKLLNMALSRVQESPRNLLIFVDLTLHDTPVETVCQRFDISRSNVDTIKHRIKKKLEPIIRELDHGDL